MHFYYSARMCVKQRHYSFCNCRNLTLGKKTETSRSRWSIHFMRWYFVCITTYGEVVPLLTARWSTEATTSGGVGGAAAHGVNGGREMGGAITWASGSNKSRHGRSWRWPRVWPLNVDRAWRGIRFVVCSVPWLPGRVRIGSRWIPSKIRVREGHVESVWCHAWIWSSI